MQRDHFKLSWLSEGNPVLPCLKTSKTVMMLREMFLLALEKYLDSLSDTCIIAADVYMSLEHFHTSKQHWKCWSVTNKERKKWPFFQCNFYSSRLPSYLSCKQGSIQNVVWVWVTLNILEGNLLETSLFFFICLIFSRESMLHMCTTASDAGYIRKKAAVLSGGLLYMQENDVNIK